jgi:hypothetical protein
VLFHVIPSRARNTAVGCANNRLGGIETHGRGLLALNAQEVLELYDGAVKLHHLADDEALLVVARALKQRVHILRVEIG